MQSISLEEIVAQPEIQELTSRSLSAICGTWIQSATAARQEGPVVTFDLTGHDVEGYNKFIPYYLFPSSVYTVSVSPSSFRTKISVDRTLGRRKSPSTTWRPFASATAAADMRGWAPSAWSRAR